MYSNNLSSCFILTTEVRYFWIISNKRSVEHLKKKKDKITFKNFSKLHLKIKVQDTVFV